MREARLIQDPDELEAALFRLRSSDRLALDTEFMRERTYHAQLCLVQIATESDCYLIDPLVGLDLAPLHELLQDRSKLKILHAARQDLEVLLQSGGAVPGPLFDTQVAAALLGFPPQVGYAELVARQLGHSIDKGQTRTDWSRTAAHARASRLRRRRRATPAHAAHRPAGRPGREGPCRLGRRRSGRLRESRAVPHRPGAGLASAQGTEPAAAGRAVGGACAGRLARTARHRIGQTARLDPGGRSALCAGHARPCVDRGAGVRPDVAAERDPQARG